MGNCCDKKKQDGVAERKKILDEMQEQMIDKDKSDGDIEKPEIHEEIVIE